MTIEILKAIETILGLCITVFGFVFAFYLYLRDRRDKTLRNLAQQIVAYDIEEEEAVKWISELSKNDKTRNILIELKDRAQKSPENFKKVRPTYNKSHVIDYLY